MKKLILSNGLQSLVDDIDYEWAKLFSWRESPYGYVTRDSIKKEKTSGSSSVIFIHRQITNAPKGVLVDHRNLNPLDNRRNNLRLCNKSQNAQNGKSHRDSTSSFRGVSWSSGKSLWRSVIFYGKRQIYLGLFDTQEDAALAYDHAALDLFGEFARPNFPDAASRSAPNTRVIRKNCSSGYRGVSWSKGRKKWHAQIQTNKSGKREAFHLGYFVEVIEAAKAYNAAAKQLFGEKARLNQIQVSQ